MSQESIIGFQTAANEAIKAYNEQLESIKSVKDTAKTIFSSTSLIVAIISSLQAIRTTPPNSPTAYLMVGLFNILFFIVLIYLCIQVLLPLKLSTPIKPVWEVFDKTFMGKEEEDVYCVITVAYLNAIELNEKAVKDVIQKTRWAGAAMILVIVGLILLILV